jgi:hypothetical protein
MILQSDNGREFVAAIIQEVMTLWDGVVIVHGRPRHPQSQGSVERANQDIEAMLGNWMNDNKTKNWVLGINFVQIAKNTRLHSGVGNPPYLLQYGQTCRYGASSLPIDPAILTSLKSEEELMEVMKSVQFVTANSAAQAEANNAAQDEANNAAKEEEEEEEETTRSPSNSESEFSSMVENDDLKPSSSVEVVPIGGVQVCIKCLGVMSPDYLCIGCNSNIHWFCAEGNSEVNESKGHGRHYWCSRCYEVALITQDAPTTQDAVDRGQEMEEYLQDITSPSSTEVSSTETLKHDTPERGNLRMSAAAAQQKQAQRMQKRVREDTIEDVPVGGICLVPIDRVDRSKVDPKRLPCVCVEITPRQQYRLACRAGVLDKVLSRQDFLYESTKTPIFYGLQDALQNWRGMKKVSIRTGSGMIAPSGGQGHLHCNCSGPCDTKRCSCLRGGHRCNSRCHPMNSKCANKCD